jgi:hypothetical protein
MFHFVTRGLQISGLQSASLIHDISLQGLCSYQIFCVLVHIIASQAHILESKKQSVFPFPSYEVFLSIELKQALKILEIFEISKHGALTCMVTARINPNKIIAYLQKKEKKKCTQKLIHIFGTFFSLLSFN